MYVEFLKEPEGGFAESCNVSNAGEGDLGSEFATGSGEALSIGEDQQLEEDGLSDVSETGWETDLEIEGVSSSILTPPQ